MSTNTCAYCGMERPERELRSCSIYFRNSKPDSRTGRMKQFVDTKTSLYCADKPCHSHDQMGHEG